MDAKGNSLVLYLSLVLLRNVSQGDASSKQIKVRDNSSFDQHLIPAPAPDRQAHRLSQS